METTSLKDLLREHIELKGLTPKKIADMTGIPERYIMTLLEGTDEYLPPSPYVHGYITKLSDILNFDKETVWRLYQKESILRHSGNMDRLPNNRFAIQPFSLKWLATGIISITIIIYLGSNIYDILTPPQLAITMPATENSVTAQPTIILQGKTNPAYTIAINGGEVYIEKDGTFKKELELREGLNTVEFYAKKFLGKETRVIRYIVYTPSALTEQGEPASTEQNKAAPTETIEKNDQSTDNKPP